MDYERERYDRSNRSAIRNDVEIIDHISYLLDPNQESYFLSELKKVLPLSSDQSWYGKPHVTLAYSKEAIEGFPKWVDSEEDYFYSIPEDQVLPLQIDTNRGYQIMVDPFGTRHVVYYLLGDYLHEAYLKYKNRNAIWEFGDYDPLIILESNTTRSLSDLSNIELIKGSYYFNIVRYRRFGQYIE